MSLSATEIGALLVDELARQGVTDVVISPGSRSAPLALAVAGDDRLRVHVRIDERTAAFLALGLGRGSGRPAAVLCSSGTAAANHVPAVVEADAAGVPLLVLTADRPVSYRDTGANQTITQVGLHGGTTRWAHDLGEGDAAYVRQTAATAVRRAGGLGVGAGPGPVHLNIPLPEPLLETDPDALAAIRRRVADGPGGPVPLVDAAPSASAGRGDRGAHAPITPGYGGRSTHAEGTHAVSADPGAAALLADRRVLVVAGEGAADGPAAVDLAARLGIPVLAEPTSGLRTTGEAVLRCGHWLAATPGFADAHVPDVVVLLGRPVLSRPVGALVRRAEVVVVCDPLDRGWDPFGVATHVVPATFADWAGSMADAAPAGGGSWPDAWRAADRVAGEALDAQLGPGVSEMGLARDLAAAMPDGSQLVVASSLAIRHLNEAMRPRDGLRLIGNRGASGIDGFTSTAIGAALGFDGPTAALAGDLSIVHDLTGLVVGADEPLPAMPIVVLDNDGGGIFDLLPYGTHVDPATFRRIFATPHGVPLQAVAMTLGHGWTHVDDPTELGQVLEDAWATPGITLVEVTTDTPAETARHRAIGQAVASALTDAPAGA